LVTSPEYLRLCGEDVDPVAHPRWRVTLAAAELTERVCCGIELDPKYIDVVIQRWQTLSGGKATLDGDGRTFEEIADERRKVPA
jgi:hypothetical protein